jgi:two-component system chemotaxis response regulator CheY
VKVLIVDDSSFMRELLTSILRKEGYKEVVEAANGEEAVQQYRRQKPDIVFMDIVMEHKDGIAALREIAKIDPEAKVVMVSVLGHDSMKKQAADAGAKHFIMKPFQESQIVDILKKLVPQ